MSKPQSMHDNAAESRRSTTMAVRAKFVCESKIQSNPENDPETRDVTFRAVYGNGEANKEWSRWTPSGTVTMQITNPGAHEQFEEGKEYFLDFTPAT